MRALAAVLLPVTSSPWRPLSHRCAPPPPLVYAVPAEIIAFDNVVVVYKFVGDLYFYATASAEENEIILAQVLATFVDTISLLLTCVAPTQRAVCPACASRVSVRRWQSTHLGLVSLSPRSAERQFCGETQRA